MEGQPTMIYRYDGSFDGLLCCVFASYLYRETPDQLVVEEDFMEVMVEVVMVVNTKLAVEV